MMLFSSWWAWQQKKSYNRIKLELSLGLGHSNITRVDTEPKNKGKLHKVIYNFVFTSKRNRKSNGILGKWKLSIQ